MNDYTTQTIAMMRHIHAIRAAIPVFIAGGPKADAALADAIRHVEAEPLSDGAHGAPINAAIAICGMAADGWYRAAEDYARDGWDRAMTNGAEAERRFAEREGR